jgi:hypothetical protein
MNAFSKIDMSEVTRLTQAGKLTEAMALLRGHLASGLAQASPAPDGPGPSRETEHPSPAIDLVAPSETGGAWAAPSQSRNRAAGESHRPNEAASSPRPEQEVPAFRDRPFKKLSLVPAWQAPEW